MRAVAGAPSPGGAARSGAGARWPAAAAALLLGSAAIPGEAKVDSRLAVFSNATQILDSCFFVDRRYQTRNGLKFKALDHLACQRRCQNTSNCEFFAFWAETQACWLAGADGVYTSVFAKGAIAGPKSCTTPPAFCTEVPGGNFPGATEQDSDMAFPSHRTPEKLDCWPKNTTGGFYGSCSNVTVLEDTEKGWPGLCMGLKKVIVPWGETCESYCRKKVSCSVYQVLDDAGKSCMHSRMHGGSHCYMRNPDPFFPAPLEAKRMMHGSVRVLKELKGVEIHGLVQAFDENYFINVTEDAVPACRRACYSNVGCQWWQYSHFSGCWVEDPKNPVPFPITTANWRMGTLFSNTVLGGEYIQHVCPGHTGLPTGATAPGATERSAVPANAASPEPTTTVAQEALVPAGQLQGVLAVHGLQFDSLTEARRTWFQENITGAVASALGVSKSWVKDEEGEPGQVTLGRDAFGTRADFLVYVPSGMSNNDVRRKLLHHAFLDQVKEAAQRSVAGQEEAFGSLVGVTVESQVMATTPLPSKPYGVSAVPPAGSSLREKNDDPSWMAVVLLPVLIGLLAAGLAFWFTRSAQGKEARKLKEPKAEKTGKAKRGHSLLATPQFSSRSERSTREPLLTGSPSTASLSSGRGTLAASSEVSWAPSAQLLPSPCEQYAGDLQGDGIPRLPELELPVQTALGPLAMVPPIAPPGMVQLQQPALPSAMLPQGGMNPNVVMQRPWRPSVVPSAVQTQVTPLALPGQFSFGP